MTLKHEKISDQLEEILAKNIDAEKGYRKAAENAINGSLKAYFGNRANSRQTFNEELKRQMSIKYLDINVDGSFTGTVHRAWMDVKSFFSADNDESMLEEAIRGEKAAIDEYEEVLEDAILPPIIASLFSKQLTQIREDLNNIKSMEDFK